MIKLNGILVPGYNIKVESNARRDEDDLSGSTSSTASNNKGWKPKILNVRTQIRFADGEDLEKLTELFEAEDKGEPKIYTILNHTANRMKINQARFVDNLNALEDDALKQWNIRFSLKEHRSVPERKKERKQAPSTSNLPKSGAGASSKTDATDTTQSIATSAPGIIEKILRKGEEIAKELLK